MRELFVRKGKFAFIQGSSTPIHFLPLQDFSLEPALNYSLLVALRMARLEANTILLDKIEIAEWRARLLTAEVPRLVSLLDVDNPTLVDIGGHDGILFEECKLAMASIGSKPHYRILTYDTDTEYRLTLLHQVEDWAYALEANQKIMGMHNIILYNTVLGLRSNETLPCLDDILFHESQGYVLVIHACENPASYGSEASHYIRTTVHGNDVALPAIAYVQDLMRCTGLEWKMAWLSNHDNDFFLPEDEAPEIGILLAYGGKSPRTARGYNTLEI